MDPDTDTGSDTDAEGRPLGSARTDAERAVEKALGEIDTWSGRRIRYAPVPGGLQNSNWRITVQGEPKRYFMKIPGAGSDAFIDRDVANQAASRASALGIGPEVVRYDPVSGVEVIEFLDDYRACTTGDFAEVELAHQVIEHYRALHSADPLSLTKTVFDMTDEHLAQVGELGVRLPDDAELLLTEYATGKAALLASGLDLVPCHNDPMPGNFLVADGKPLKLIDFEFASNNDRAYELAVLITEMFYTEEQTLELLEAYYGSAGWALTARIQVFSALADVKWGLWGCVNSALITSWDFDYAKYGRWKLMRARLKMTDPRWPFWLASV